MTYQYQSEGALFTILPLKEGGSPDLGDHSYTLSSNTSTSYDHSKDTLYKRWENIVHQHSEYDQSQWVYPEWRAYPTSFTSFRDWVIIQGFDYSFHDNYTLTKLNKHLGYTPHNLELRYKIPTLSDITNAPDGLKEELQRLRDGYEQWRGLKYKPDLYTPWRLSFNAFYNWYELQTIQEDMSLRKVDTLLGYEPDNLIYVPKGMRTSDYLIIHLQRELKRENEALRMDLRVAERELERVTRELEELKRAL